MNDLSNIKCFLLDMDGTIYLGDKLIDGAKDFLDKLGKNRYIFLTNNSSRGKNKYIEKLKKLGIQADANDVFSSADATILYLKEKKENPTIFLLGTKDLENEFKNHGFNIIKERNKKIDFVVLGFDTSLTYEKLWIACDYLMEGVEFIATHPDYTCPIEDGKFMPDIGAMIDFLVAATSKKPLIIGKPNKYIIEAIEKKFNLKRDEIAIVGDRLYTDIKTGKNNNITSILVLSGETNIDMYKNSDIKATFVYESVKDMIADL